MINKIRSSCIAATILLMLISISTVSLAATLTVPTLVGNYDTAGLAEDVAVSGNYAYIADYENGLVIVDINNNYSPKLMGNYNTAGYATAVAVSGNYAYVADMHNGIIIVDVSNPSAPVSYTHLTLP